MKLITNDESVCHPIILATEKLLRLNKAQIEELYQIINLVPELKRETSQLVNLLKNGEIEEVKERLAYELIEIIYKRKSEKINLLYQIRKLLQLDYLENDDEDDDEKELFST